MAENNILPGSGPSGTMGPPAAAAASLSARAFRGAMWTTGASLAVKTCALASQLIIAKILLPKDFGTVGLVYSVTAFTALLQQNSLREILVQRGDEFDALSSTAWQLSLATGVLVALLTAAAGPFAAHIYHAPGLVGLLAVAAAGAPFGALQAVPGARLQIEMRFRLLSGIATAESLCLTTLSLCFARLGFGPYSIIAPLPVVQLLSLLYQCRTTRFTVRVRFERAKWRSLLGASGLMLGAATLYAFNAQGASVILGLFKNVQMVGIFFFANNFSAQITGMITANLWTILLPTLGVLQADPARQRQAFIRLCNAVSLVGMPLCFALAAITDPVLRLLYGSKWLAAIPVIQILSMGAAFGIPFALAINLMMAQGRYRSLLTLNFFRSAGFITLVALGAWWADARGVAVGAALFNVVYGPLTLFAAIRPVGGTKGEVWNMYARPMAAAGLSIMAAAGLGAALPGVWDHPLAQVGVVLCFALVLYPAFCKWFMPTTWKEIVSHVSVLRLRRGGAA